MSTPSVPFASAGVSELHRSLSLAAAAFEVIDEPLLVFDTAGNLVCANEAARSMGPLSSLFIPGFHHLDCLDLLDTATWREVDAHAHPLERALEGEPSISGRYGLRGGANGRILLDLMTRPVLSGGVRCGAVAVLRPLPADAPELTGSGRDADLLSEAEARLADTQDHEEAPGVISRLLHESTGALATILWEANERGPLLRSLEGNVDELIRREVRDGAGAALVAGRRSVGEVQLVGGTAILWHEPLTLRGDTVGVMTVVWPGSLRGGNHPLGLLPKLAEIAASTLERASLLDHLVTAASTDPVTGVANRRAFEERLERELQRAAADGTQVSVAVLNLDNFAEFRLRNGDPASDRLLRETSRVWSEQLRGSDLLARVGGTEFVALLPDCPLVGAQRVSGRMADVTPRQQTASVGVTVWDGKASGAELLALAESLAAAARQSSEASGAQRRAEQTLSSVA